MAALRDHTRDRRRAGGQEIYGGEIGLIFSVLAPAPKPVLQQQHKTTIYPQSRRYRNQPQF